MIQHNIHHFPIKIYVEDTDAAGMVYYANYLKFAQRARTELFQDMGIDHACLLKDHQIMVLVKHCTINYCAPAHLGDKLVIESQVKTIMGASLTVQQTAWRETDKIAEMKVKLACVSVDGNIRRIPKFIIDILNKTSLQ